jgi:hypothetical protein
VRTTSLFPIKIFEILIALVNEIATGRAGAAHDNYIGMWLLLSATMQNLEVH